MQQKAPHLFFRSVVSSHSLSTFISQNHSTHRHCHLFSFSMAGFSRTLASSSLVLTSLVLFSISFCEARDILVGGKTDSWKIPSSQSDSLNQWAEKTRFQIGDSLVWKYDATRDSVLQVTKEAYLSCNTSSPVAEYRDGNTKVKLNKSGPFYFISGTKGSCEKGQKLIVVVMSSRRRYTGISPAPAPMEFDGPAVAPTSSAASFKASLVLALGGLLAWVLF